MWTNILQTAEVSENFLCPLKSLSHQKATVECYVLATHRRARFFGSALNIHGGQNPLFMRLGDSEQKKGGGGDATPIHSTLSGLPQHVGT